MKQNNKVLSRKKQVQAAVSMKKNSWAVIIGDGAEEAAKLENRRSIMFQKQLIRNCIENNQINPIHERSMFKVDVDKTQVRGYFVDFETKAKHMLIGKSPEDKFY